MTRRVIVEVVLEAEVQDEEQLLSQCLANFRAADWSDDPSGAALARLEEQLRANLDQVGLQNIIRPSCLLDDIAASLPRARRQ